MRHKLLPVIAKKWLKSVYIYRSYLKFKTAAQAYCFLQRVSIACYAERCISHSKSVRPSVCLSVTRWHCVKTTQAIVMGSSLEDSPMTLVSSCLTSRQNSKGNMGSESVE